MGPAPGHVCVAADVFPAFRILKIFAATSVGFPTPCDQSRVPGAEPAAAAPSPMPDGSTAASAAAAPSPLPDGSIAANSPAAPAPMPDGSTAASAAAAQAPAATERVKAPAVLAVGGAASQPAPLGAACVEPVPTAPAVVTPARVSEANPAEVVPASKAALTCSVVRSFRSPGNTHTRTCTKLTAPSTPEHPLSTLS